MVMLRRKHPKVHGYSRVAYQDSKWRNQVMEVSATMRSFLMVHGASMNMHEANPLNEVRDRVQGGIDIGEAIETFDSNAAIMVPSFLAQG
jgi:hypothetical protein